MATTIPSQPVQPKSYSPQILCDERIPMSSNSTSYADPSRPRKSASSGTLVANDDSPSSPHSLSSASSVSTSPSPPARPSIVVPQYPYNVSMPQGCFHSNERGADDNDVQTRLPSICVDYLSHDWDESDVWASWKVMTRQKNEVANGVRLENASWRTWAKQRNNLKTISPETLNWLKDSDVTWLYGPLHTAVDPVPPPKQATVSDRLTLDAASSSLRAPTMGQSALSPSGSAPSTRPTSAMGHRPRPSKLPGKPILKHRSLSEILGVNGPVSPPASEPTSATATDDDTYGSCDESGSARHVSIAPASSDSTITDKYRTSDTLLAPGARSRTTSADGSVEGGNSGDDSDARARSGSRPPSGSDDNNGNGRKKKHISFSHRVEQCIAVDSSEEERGFHIGPDDDDDDGEDEEDDMLMFRTSSSLRHHPRHQLIRRNELAAQSSNVTESPSANSSGHTDPVTIARMAPTTLKSAESYPAPSPAVVYDDDDPLASWQSNAMPPVVNEPASTSGNEDSQGFVPSYLVRTFGSGGIVDAGNASSSSNPQTIQQSNGIKASYVNASDSSSSKNRWEDPEDFSGMGFDYFSGPDLGVGDEYDMPSLPSQHLASGAGYGVQGHLRGGADISPSSSGTATPASVKGRDSQDPPTIPKSILKQASTSGDAPLVKVPSPSSPVDVPGAPITSGSSTSSMSSQNMSPQNNNLAATVVTSQPDPGGGPPSPVAERPDRRSRGRSSSRGSSSSGIERSSGADRRASCSPSQSPPNTLGPHIGSAANRSSGPGSSVARLGRQGTSSFGSRSGSSNSLSPDGKWSRGGGDEEENVLFIRSGKGLQAMNGSDVADSRAMGTSVQSQSTTEPADDEHASKEPGQLMEAKREQAKSLPKVNGAGLPAGDTIVDAKDEVRGKANHKLPKPHRGMSGSNRLLSAPRPASTHLADDSDNEHLFDSPHLPSSPTTSELGSGTPRRNGSMSSISTLRWSDDTQISVAHRSLLRQYSPSNSTTFSDASKQTISGPSGSRGRAHSDDERTLRRFSGDDYGFGYGYSDEEDAGGVVGRAAEIMGTAKDLVGALWTVGSRSLWRKSDLAKSNKNSTAPT